MTYPGLNYRMKIPPHGLWKLFNEYFYKRRNKVKKKRFILPDIFYGYPDYLQEYAHRYDLVYRRRKRDKKVTKWQAERVEAECDRR